MFRLGALDVCEINEDDLEISEVAVPNVPFFRQEQEAMATLSTFLEQQQNIVNELETNLWSLIEKSITISCIQESHQTTIDSYVDHEVGVNLLFIKICDDIFVSDTNGSIDTTARGEPVVIYR